MTEMELLAQDKRLVATLEKVACRAVHRGIPAGRAVADLRRVSTDPVLLGVAAGRASGRWTAVPLFREIGQEAAELLLKAGADSDVAVLTAVSAQRRLGRCCDPDPQRRKVTVRE